VTIYELAERHRAALLAQDAAASARMVEAYATAWQSIRRGIGQVIRDAAKAQAGLDAIRAEAPDDGKRVRRAIAKLEQKLLLQARYRALLTQTADALGQASTVAADAVTDAQRAVVGRAEEEAKAAVLASLGPEPVPGAELGITARWNRVPQEAVEALVGQMGDGSPLGRVFTSFAGADAQAVRDRLLIGLVKGFNPNKIAEGVNKAIGGSLARATTIARTETLRSYRIAALDNYEANDDVVTGWRWHAHLGPRTCAACIAMHGKVFPLTTEFGSHPNCRCAPVPVTATWEELGFGTGIPEPPTGPTGAEWLAQQDADTQREVLGAKYEAYRTGTISLKQVVGYRNDPEWGPTRWERSAKALGLTGG
jgi:SPP1 gp7 family putative phage head morphogenesis protein